MSLEERERERVQTCKKRLHFLGEKGESNRALPFSPAPPPFFSPHASRPAVRVRVVPQPAGPGRRRRRRPGGGRPAVRHCRRRRRRARRPGGRCVARVHGLGGRRAAAASVSWGVGGRREGSGAGRGRRSRVRRGSGSERRSAAPRLLHSPPSTGALRGLPGQLQTPRGRARGRGGEGGGEVLGGGGGGEHSQRSQMGMGGRPPRHPARALAWRLPFVVALPHPPQPSPASSSSPTSSPSRWRAPPTPGSGRSSGMKTRWWRRRRCVV